MYLESCRTPIHKLNTSFGLNTRNSCINVLRHHVPTKQQTAGHVFSMTRVALHHLVSRFKASSCDLSDTQLFVVGFLGRDNWSVSGQRKVYTGVRHQIGLKSKVKNRSLSCCLFNLLSASIWHKFAGGWFSSLHSRRKCFPGFPVFASPKKTDKHAQILIRPGRHAQTEHFWTSSSEFLISVSWLIIQFLLNASNKPKSKDIKDRRLGKTSFP